MLIVFWDSFLGFFVWYLLRVFVFFILRFILLFYKDDVYDKAGVLGDREGILFYLYFSFYCWDMIVFMEGFEISIIVEECFFISVYFIFIWVLNLENRIFLLLVIFYKVVFVWIYKEIDVFVW